MAWKTANHHYIHGSCYDFLYHARHVHIRLSCVHVDFRSWLRVYALFRCGLQYGSLRCEARSRGCGYNLRRLQHAEQRRKLPLPYHHRIHTRFNWRFSSRLLLNRMHRNYRSRWSDTSTSRPEGAHLMRFSSNPNAGLSSFYLSFISALMR